MGLRRRVHILQLLVSIIVLLSSLGCITHAFSPSAASQKVSPLSLKTVPTWIRPRHYHYALSTSSHNIDGDKRYPNVDRIDIITSQIQHGLSTIITSFVIFAAILTSPINSEAIAMTENQQFVVSRQRFLCCFFVQYDIYKTYISFSSPYTGRCMVCSNSTIL